MVAAPGGLALRLNPFWMPFLNLAGLYCRAAKHAWLIETKRADILGKDVSDERLNHLYKQGKQWFARHVDKSDVRPPRNTYTSGCPRTMRSHMIHTCLMIRR